LYRKREIGGGGACSVAQVIDGEREDNTMMRKSRCMKISKPWKKLMRNE